MFNNVSDGLKSQARHRRKKGGTMDNLAEDLKQQWLETLLAVTIKWVLLASSGSRPRMSLNTLQ